MLSSVSLKVRWLILFIFTTTICLACAIYATIHAGQSEGVLELIHDAGYVREGQAVKHEFPIVNKTRKPMDILSIKANCSCNLPKEIGQPIAPKSTYKLPMSITTEGHSGLTTAVAMITLGSQREIRCVLKCHVVTGYPKELVFPNLMKGEEIKKEFFFQNIAEEKVSINNITYPQEYFNIEWNEHAMEDEQISAYKISVVLKTDISYGAFNQWITIETDDPLDADKRVEIRGYVRQPIECDKTRIAFGIIEGNSRKIEKIRIFSPYNKPFEIIKVENAKGDRCNLHLEKLDDTSYELQIAIDGNEDEARAIISEEISIYGIVEKTQVQVRQDIHVFAMIGHN